VQSLRDVLTALAASDSSFKRFGAAQHRYAVLPPIADVELALPDDYRDYITGVSAGGVGPYYGLIPAQRAAAFVQPAPSGVVDWTRALPLSHLACGYFAVTPIDCPADGQSWLDYRQIGITNPIRRT